MIATFCARWPDCAIRVGPRAIAVRAGPLGRLAQSDGRTRITLADKDPKVRGRFGAASMLGYVARLALPAVEAITLGNVTGPRGLFDNPADGPLLPHPAFFAVYRLRGGEIMVDVRGSQPRRPAALALRRDDEIKPLPANRTSEPIALAIEGMKSPAHVEKLEIEESWALVRTPDVWRTLRRDCGLTHILGPNALTSARPSYLCMTSDAL